MKEWSTSNISIIKMAVLVIAAGLLLVACSKHSDRAVRQPPVAIRPGDTCAVCGMYITHYPGPRGEAYIQGQKVPLKFGSTRDFFAYVLQPQHKPMLETLYVQDMAATSWKHPEGHWIDARTAWYVPESALPGAMGPTLASFLHHKDAVAFARRYGGKVIRFDDVTDRLITDFSMQKMPMRKGQPASHQEKP